MDERGELDGGNEPSTRPRFLQITDDIRVPIASGTPTEHDTLPSGRSLSEQYIVIRMRGVQAREAELLSIAASHTVIEPDQVIRDDAGTPFYFGRQVWRGEMAEFSAHAIVTRHDQTKFEK